MAAVTVSRSADCLIAVKQVPAERAGDIEREADLLKRLDHPGVVRFIDILETPDGGRALHTEFVSSDTWVTRPLTDPAERAAGMAALAAVVADLHDSGVAHGQLSGAHVLHGDNDRPVLCGLTLAAEANPENRHSDLAALADLCHDRTLQKGPLTGKLSSLADAARAGRLSARELASRLDLLLAKRAPVSEPSRAAGGSVSGRIKKPRRKSLIIAGILAAAAVALAVGVWSRGEPAPDAPVIAIEGPEPHSTAAGNQATEVAPLTAGGASGSAGSAADGASGSPSPDADGASGSAGPAADGAPTTSQGGARVSGSATAASEVEPDADATSGEFAGSPPSAASGDPTGNELAPEFLVQESAAVLEHDGRRYAVGAPGDFVETGDWDCDGRDTPAIVRPATGDVVLFDAWPDPGQSISMPVRWNVDSPAGAEAVADGPCDLLRVYTATGSRLLDPKESQ